MQSHLIVVLGPVLTVLTVLAVLAPACHASPYIPAKGSEILEQLPRRSDPAQQELQRLRAQLAAAPHELALATRVAQTYIARARSTSDPRYFGYAQAALAPWWAMPAPPLEVRLLRATLLQSTHHFPEALQDLDAIVAADPQHVQAWLTRATVHTVRGNYEQARSSCARLSTLSTQLVSHTCIAGVGAMSGRLAHSEQLLSMALERAPDAGLDLQVWALTLLAEMAERRGDHKGAEARFTKALGIDPGDSYLIGAYADFLLDRQRPQEVLDLVKPHARIDALLLRQAMAQRQLPGQSAAFERANADLQARFNAAMRRGDTVHLREQARYELHVRGNAERALALAQQNWEVQKETADMRILLEAALAHQRTASAPVLAWIFQHGVEDVNLARLAKQIKAKA